MPLVMEGREKGEVVAATRAVIGTDVNFGSLTRALTDWLGKQDGVRVHLNHRVSGLNRGLFDEVSQARISARFAGLREARQPPGFAGGLP